MTVLYLAKTGIFLVVLARYTEFVFLGDNLINSPF